MRSRSGAAAFMTTMLLAFLALFFGNSGFLFLMILTLSAIYILFVAKFLKWVAKIARKNNRSVTGFVWLAVFFPVIVAVILLIIDKDDKPKSN